MNWLKTLWQFIFGKDVIKQDKVDSAIIDQFAKALDGLLDFDKILKGKLSWFEKYDEWAFKQILNAFVLIFSAKVADTFWGKFEDTMVLFNEGKYDESSALVAKELNKVINTGMAENLEELVLIKQVSLLFELAGQYMNNVTPQVAGKKK